jgi:SagB-type dehydrogenase family enzyme
MKIILPEPRRDGPISLEQCLHRRRCRRKFSPQPLTLQEISQLAWAAQGITSSRGHRACPSAGALYPLELLIIAGNVQEMAAGAYRYSPRGHALGLIVPGDMRAALAEAGLRQPAIENAPASLLLTAVYERTTGKYGRRGIQYVHLEAGHSAQNVCLQATALGLGSVMIGAFHDDGIKEILPLSGEEEPLYILPVGR